MRKVYTLLLAMTFIGALNGQTLPKVFQLGEFEKAYQEVSTQSKLTLLDVSNNDIVSAFETWLKMTEAMEAYAKKIQFEINGVKLWLHVFFAEDGSIQHIGYVLRQNSKNILKEDFEAFLKSFMTRYQLPVVSEQPFAHYSIASFPVHVQEYEKN